MHGRCGWFASPQAAGYFPPSEQTEAQNGFEFFTGALIGGSPCPEGAQGEGGVAEEGKEEDERETSTLLQQVIHSS